MSFLLTKLSLAKGPLYSIIMFGQSVATFAEKGDSLNKVRLISFGNRG